MLPRRDHFLEELAFFLLYSGLPLKFDGATIDAALAEAERLVTGEADEPAVLFYVCARRSRAFGSAARLVLPFLARSQAKAINKRLTAQALELEMLRAAVLRGEVSVDQVRAWFAERLRSL